MRIFYYIRIMEQILFFSYLQSMKAWRCGAIFYSIVLSAPQEGHTTLTGYPSVDVGICTAPPQAGHVPY